MEFPLCTYYYGPSYDLFSLYILGLVMAPFFLLFVALPFKLVFVFISFLFDRCTSEPQGSFDACEYVLKNLAARHKGAFYRFNSRRLVCLLPERHLYLEVERNIYAQLRIHKEYPHKTTIWKRRLRFGEVSHDRMIGWIRCVETLVEKSEKFLLNLLSGEQRCAYCREWLESNVSTVRCFQCNAPYHLDCFQVNSGCAVFGCREQQATATIHFATSIHDKVKSHTG
jgi:hypothetical protein